MELNTPLKDQQKELDLIMNLDAQLRQKQNLAAIGQRYTDIVWAAGLFEGEGSIFIRKQHPNTRSISIAMTDKDVMQKFVNVVGYGNLNGPYKSTNKLLWSWEIAKKIQVLRILKMFLPHFGIRRAEKAIEAITFLNETIN